MIATTTALFIAFAAAAFIGCCLGALLAWEFAPERVRNRRLAREIRNLQRALRGVTDAGYVVLPIEHGMAHVHQQQQQQRGTMH